MPNRYAAAQIPCRTGFPVPKRSYTLNCELAHTLRVDFASRMERICRAMLEAHRRWPNLMTERSAVIRATEAGKVRANHLAVRLDTSLRRELLVGACWMRRLLVYSRP